MDLSKIQVNQKIIKMTNIAGDEDQGGHLMEVGGLVVGPGGKREGGRASLTLPDLPSSERSSVQRAKKYAMEQSIKIVLIHIGFAIIEQINHGHKCLSL